MDDQTELGTQVVTPSSIILLGKHLEILLLLTYTKYLYEFPVVVFQPTI